MLLSFTFPSPPEREVERSAARRWEVSAQVQTFDLLGRPLFTGAADEGYDLASPSESGIRVRGRHLHVGKRMPDPRTRRSEASGLAAMLSPTLRARGAKVRAHYLHISPDVACGGDAVEQHVRHEHHDGRHRSARATMC